MYYCGFLIFLAVQLTGTDVISFIFLTRNNRKLISLKGAFSTKNITFRPKI